MTTKLISGTGLQLLRRYDKKPGNSKAQLLDDVSVSLLMYLYVARRWCFFCELKECICCFTTYLVFRMCYRTIYLFFYKFAQFLIERGSLSFVLCTL